MSKRRSKDIGTAGESSVVRYLQTNGFPHAERRALRSRYDCGDITGTPGLVWEVKAGDAARNASDGQVDRWLAETETERVNARADIGILVVVRKGIGEKNAGRWWAILRGSDIFTDEDESYAALEIAPVRLTLSVAVTYLHCLEYGHAPADLADQGGAA